MEIIKPCFTGNVIKVELLKDRIVIHYHLRRDWNVPDVIGIITVDYDSIERLPQYQNRDVKGNYLNDRNGSYSFYDIRIPKCNKVIVAVFQNIREGEVDMYGDSVYPEDDIIGIFRHEDSSPLRVIF